MRAEIATAARWWAVKLSGPKGELGEQTSAERDPSVELMYAVGTAMLAPQPEAIALFKVSLERVLRERLEALPERYRNIAFGTDYGPDQELGEALDCAGLNRYSMLLLPMKTTMRLASQSVKVGLGHGAEFVDLLILQYPLERGSHE